MKYLKYTLDKNILLSIEYTERIRHTNCNGLSSSYRDSSFVLADSENIDMSNLMAFNIGNVRASDIFAWIGCSQNECNLHGSKEKAAEPSMIPDFG